MLQPTPARWFEVLCSRREGVRTVAHLAATGAVELEVRRASPTDLPLERLAAGLAEYDRLRPRYERYWQRGRLRLSPLVDAPDRVVDLALARLAAWRGDADPLIDALQASEEELNRLKRLSEILGQLSNSGLDLERLAQAGPLLSGAYAIVPAQARLELPGLVIARALPWQGQHCFLLLAPAAEIDEVKRHVQAAKGRLIPYPGWVSGNAAEARAQILAHCQVLAARVVHLYAELDALFEDYALGDVLGEVAWLSWFGEHVGGLELAGDHLVWITGWTDDPTGRALAESLERAQSRALLRFAPPPAASGAPQILINPAWARPFEIFARALGVPGGDEVDPTPVLAVIVPLLFGYMFGDLGQGLVLAGVGAWLQGRFPLARLVVYCGLSSMFFGLLFGSVFAREDLVPALWLHPLDEPILVLLVPLLCGAALLSLGQVFAALGATRRGALRHWLLVDAGFFAGYLGLLVWLVRPDWPGLALLGLLWYLVGAILTERCVRGVAIAVGRLLETALQIAVNTLSFARVGAFALAHAALAAAVVAMADAAPGPAGILILAFGNLLLIALEGLVVSIQTTRLVLFEFFNRFLHGTGRVFRPLPPPPAVVAPA